METKDHKAVGIFLINQIMEKVERPLQWAFLWGCVEPDFNVFTYLKGSMYGEKFRGHNYENAYERVKYYVKKLEKEKKEAWGFAVGEITDQKSGNVQVQSQNDLKERSVSRKAGVYRVFWRLSWYFMLGKLTHYVADSFTFPHNKEFPGNLTEHVKYESELHNYLISTLKLDMHAWRLLYPKYELAFQIGQMHEQYVKVSRSYVTDCCYILNALVDVMEHFAGRSAEWLDEKVA